MSIPARMIATIIHHDPPGKPFGGLLDRYTMDQARLAPKGYYFRYAGADGLPEFRGPYTSVDAAALAAADEGYRPMPEQPEKPLVGRYIQALKGNTPLITPERCEGMSKAEIWVQYELDRDLLIAERDALQKSGEALCKEQLTPEVFDRVAEWLQDPARKHATAAFTSGMERQICYLLELDVLPRVKRMEADVCAAREMNGEVLAWGASVVNKLKELHTDAGLRSKWQDLEKRLKG